MRIYPTVAIVLSVLAAGVAGWFVRDGCVATSLPGEPPFASAPTAHSDRGLVDASIEPLLRLRAGAIESRPTDLAHRLDVLAAEVGALRLEDSTRWDAITSDLEGLKARMAGMAVTQEALAKQAGVPPPWPSDPAEVEKVRDRWRAQLEETEKILRERYPRGPDPHGDLAVWSRFDDLQKARAALAAATDSASLRALGEGEFRSYFAAAR